MQQCGTTYSKALLLSVMVHVAVVGSAIAFAQYGGTYFDGNMRSITVSLLGSTVPGRPGIVRQAHKKQGVSVPSPDAPDQDLKKDLPKDVDLLHEAPPAPGGEAQEEGTAEAGPRSLTSVREVPGHTGEISPGQWQLVHAALEKAKTYPRMARERGVEGVVLVRFKVLPTGEIEKVDIIRSSGSDVLDTATVRTVYRAAPMPYVNGWVEVPMSYVLK